MYSIDPVRKAQVLASAPSMNNYTGRAVREYLEALRDGQVRVFSGSCAGSPVHFGTAVKNFIEQAFLTTLKPFLTEILLCDADEDDCPRDYITFLIFRENDREPRLITAFLSGPDHHEKLVYCHHHSDPDDLSDL